MTLHQLRARRAELRTAAAAIIASAEAAGGFTDEQRATYDATVTDLERVTGDEQRMERAAALDATAAGRVIGDGAAAPEFRVFEGGPSRAEAGATVNSYRLADGGRVPVLGSEQRIASFLPAGATAAADLGLAGFLGALVNGPRTETERRAWAEGSVATGGAFLPAPLAGEILDFARARTVAFQAGAQTVPMTAKTLRMARILSHPTPAWRAENAVIAESEPTFGDMTLDAKSLAVRFNVSRELLEDVAGMDGLVRTIMADAFAIALDQAILFGTGTANMPRGLANTPGVQEVSMGTNGAALAGYAPLLDAIAALEGVNEGAVSAIVYAPRTGRVIAGLTDTTGQPLNAPERLAGIPRLVTTAVPVNETQGTSSNASSIFLGDFRQVLVGLRTSLQVTVLPERFAEFGQVGFIGWLRADVGVARPAALARIKGIRP